MTDQNVALLLEAVRTEGKQRGKDTSKDKKFYEHRKKMKEDVEKKEGKGMSSKSSRYVMPIDQLPSRHAATMDKRVTVRIIPVKNERQMNEIYYELETVLRELDTEAKWTELYSYE